MSTFASFFFRWSLDRNDRLVFSIVPDITGRNIKPFGRSLIHYPRWVETGYMVELMRLTDFINSLPLLQRRELSTLARMNLMRPSEALVTDLWDVAKGRLQIKSLLEKHTSACMFRVHL